MPINNGSGAFNIGRDNTLTLIGPFGQVTLVNVMSFGAKQETASINEVTMAGEMLNAELPRGWSGSFMVDRGSNDLDALFAAQESAWFTGGVLAVSTMYQRIVETNASVTTYQFTNVSLKLDNAGDFKGDSVVQQSVSFRASRRIAV